MKRDPVTRAPDFYRFARGDLHTYLPTVARRSPNTVEAYRTSLECFLHYLADDQHIDRAYVSFDHFDRQHLKGWLAWMADQQHYAPRTVGLRLTAVKACLAYCAAEDIALVAVSQGARGASRREKSDRVPHRTADTGRARRLHRPHHQIAPEPDAADPALRHRRPRR
jgi:hypothetical protein